MEGRVRCNFEVEVSIQILPFEGQSSNIRQQETATPQSNHENPPIDVQDVKKTIQFAEGRGKEQEQWMERLKFHYPGERRLG